RSAPRASAVFGRDPDAPTGDTRVLVRDKANYAPDAAKAVRFRFESAIVQGVADDGEPEDVPTSRVVEVGACQYTAAQVIRATRADENDGAGRSPKLREAILFLEELLADG